MFPHISINTKRHLLYQLRITNSMLEKILNNIDGYYYEKTEIKYDNSGNIKVDVLGNVKTRLLHPSVKSLKLVQRRIQSNILLKLPMPDYAYGGIKKRDNILNAKKHQGRKFIFTTDLKNFYPSITNKKVFEMFRNFNFSPTVARILTQLTTYKGRLPQGSPTSSMIANLVFVKTGKKLEAFAKENKLTFTSFVDDLTFSAPINFKERAVTIIEIIKLDGFAISHKKTQYKTKNPTVTGIVVKNNSLDLPLNFKIKLLNAEGLKETQVIGLKLYEQRVLNFEKSKKIPVVGRINYDISLH